MHSYIAIYSRGEAKKNTSFTALLWMHMGKGITLMSVLLPFKAIVWVVRASYKSIQNKYDGLVVICHRKLTICIAFLVVLYGKANMRWVAGIVNRCGGKGSRFRFP